MEPIEIEQAAARFACPVPWCAGDVWEHGGDGAPPETWMHAGDDDALPGGALGRFVREPGRAIEYSVNLSIESSEDAGSLPRLADELRQLAAALDARAGNIAGGYAS